MLVEHIVQPNLSDHILLEEEKKRREEEERLSREREAASEGSTRGVSGPAVEASAPIGNNSEGEQTSDTSDAENAHEASEEEKSQDDTDSENK